MNQRLERLDGVSVIIRQPVLRLIELAKTKLNSTLLVVHGFRSLQAQLLIYQEGRRFDRDTNTWVVEDPARLRTRAKPGTSAHNVIERASGKPASMAVDLVPLLPNGQANWEPGEAYWDDLYELAWKVGLDPLGDPTGAWLKGDMCHFQEPGWSLKLEGLGLALPAPAIMQV